MDEKWTVVNVTVFKHSEWRQMFHERLTNEDRESEVDEDDDDDDVGS